MRSLSNAGQLSLPILAVLLFFSMGVCLHVRRSLDTYYDMKLDIAADMTALSAARTQAQLLNSLASIQNELLPVLPKLSVLGSDIGVMSAKSLERYWNIHKRLQMGMSKFYGEIHATATAVASANGATKVLIPKTLDLMQPRLKGEEVWVVIITPKPVLMRLSQAYYTREWKTDIIRAQPDHKHIWWVFDHRGEMSPGRARLWLDLAPGVILNNGGFPSPKKSFLNGLGIKSLAPHFNAQLMPRKKSE